MSVVSYLEVRPDFLRGKAYASRNYNDLRHSVTKWGTDRSQVDWLLTLRQQRPSKDSKAPTLFRSPASAPNLHDPKERHPRTKDPELGNYHEETGTMEKYQNVANTSHMCNRLMRVSSGDAQSIDWQLNLRGGLHQQPDALWRRHFTKSQVSFDRTKENCARDNEAYQKFKVTPLDRRPDLEANAIHAESLRKDDILFKRWPGAEGTNAGTWRHLVTDHKHGYKSRGALRWETTLREDPNDTYGARIQDSRSDGCITEMLGKKKWHFAENNKDFLSRPVPEGDPKLNYIGTHIGIITEDDQAVTEKRRNKQKRTDEDQLGNFRNADLGRESRLSANQDDDEEA